MYDTSEKCVNEIETHLCDAKKTNIVIYLNMDMWFDKEQEVRTLAQKFLKDYPNLIITNIGSVRENLVGIFQAVHDNPKDDLIKNIKLITNDPVNLQSFHDFIEKNTGVTEPKYYCLPTPEVQSKLLRTKIPATPAAKPKIQCSLS
jgi:hypothetical protein